MSKAGDQGYNQLQQSKGWRQGGLERKLTLNIKTAMVWRLESGHH